MFILEEVVEKFLLRFELAHTRIAGVITEGPRLTAGLLMEREMEKCGGDDFAITATTLIAAPAFHYFRSNHAFNSAISSVVSRRFGGM